MTKQIIADSSAEGYWCALHEREPNFERLVEDLHYLEGFVEGAAHLGGLLYDAAHGDYDACVELKQIQEQDRRLTK